jgi:hypothetical protein
MATTTVTVRCPSCGQGLRATVAPTPPTQWFPCPNCHVPVPVVAPRDLPPLYSWEVIPGLYPQLAPLRRPRWRMTSVAAIALAVAAALAAITAGLLGQDGVVAAEPGSYVVSGTVFEDLGGGFSRPAAGALVVLYADNNRSFGSELTGVNGTFRFAGVPAGGITVNATARNYAPTVVYTFASKDYSTQTLGLNLTLEPGGVNNTSSVALTPFPDLETFLAYVGGGAVLLALAAAVAATGALAVRRPEGAVAGVIGGGAAVSVPAVMLFLSLGGLFLPVTILAGAVGGAGAFALVLATVQVASHGKVPGPA